MKQIENMVIDNIKKCFDGKLSSKDLGLWAEKLWYYYVEGKGKNITLKNEGKILDLLLDIASQWGMISSPFSGESEKAKFPEEWLEEWLKKLDRIKNAKK